MPEHQAGFGVSTIGDDLRLQVYWFSKYSLFLDSYLNRLKDEVALILKMDIGTTYALRVRQGRAMSSPRPLAPAALQTSASNRVSAHLVVDWPARNVRHQAGSTSRPVS